MTGQRLKVESSAGLNAEMIRAKSVRGNPDVSALASLDKNKLAVLAWHYHDDDLPGPAAAIELALDHLPIPTGKVSVTHYRLMRSTAIPTKRGSGLVRRRHPRPNNTRSLKRRDNWLHWAIPRPSRSRTAGFLVRLRLPRQAVALLVCRWE